MLRVDDIADEHWRNYLSPEFDKDYMRSLMSYLDAEYASGKTIFPLKDDVFSALSFTPMNDVRVVILGQDPYHGAGQAHGLSFSVKAGIKTPPSLANIYKELKSDLGINVSTSGYLGAWAKQGVLLLNSVLTVEESKAASHQKKGWEQFTDVIIRKVAQSHTPVVFILWGAYAQKKAAFVDASKHLVLQSAHPSPLSAYNGFFGSQPFSQTNDFLRANGQAPIDWELPNSGQGELF